MSLGLTDDKSTLVPVMAWCRQATSHYLSQCWPRSLSAYDVTSRQWVKHFIGLWISLFSVGAVSVGESVSGTARRACVWMSTCQPIMSGALMRNIHAPWILTALAPSTSRDLVRSQPDMLRWVSMFSESQSSDMVMAWYEIRVLNDVTVN